MPLPAKVVQGLAIVLFVWGATCASTPINQPVPEGKGDVVLYRAIVARVTAGENYYQVAGQELHNREYATVPLFNWRLPTLAVSLAYLQTERVAGHVLLSLGILTAIVWCFYLLRAGHGLLCFLSLPLFLSMLPAWGGSSVVFHEVWSGQLITLSLGFRLLGLVTPAVVAGALALSVRELALPYILIRSVLAWAEGRRREAIGWASVVGIFAAGLFVHFAQARLHLPPNPWTNNWMATGGWCQVLMTAKTNLALIYLPAPWLSLAVSVLWAGLWAWRSPGVERVAIVVSAYFAAFALVGRTDNFYWGLMIAPLLPLGVLGWILAFFPRPSRV
jgi:hypothetical protein